MTAGAPGTILVTGANGFVGVHALRALRASFPAARLVGSVHRAGTACPDADDVVALDLRDSARIDAIIADLAQGVIARRDGVMATIRLLAERDD